MSPFNPDRDAARLAYLTEIEMDSSDDNAIRQTKILVRDGTSQRHEFLIQFMPESRTRLNPAAVPDICCFLIAASEEWERILKVNHRGMTPHQRASLRGQKEYARHAISAVKKIMERMLDSVNTHVYVDTCHKWFNGVTGSMVVQPVDASDPDTDPVLGGEG